MLEEKRPGEFSREGAGKRWSGRARSLGRLAGPQLQADEITVGLGGLKRLTASEHGISSCWVRRRRLSLGLASASRRK
jgi:hypothetical protein